jgi:hypothetical protein
MAPPAVSVMYPPKTYKDLRRIRVGTDATKQELTTRFFARGATPTQSGKQPSTPKKRASNLVSKTYVGLTDVVSNQENIVTWDPRYQQFSGKKRMETVKNDWLAEFRTLDVATQEETPKKKIKTVHQDETVPAFLNGEVLTTKALQRISRDLASVLRLKDAPPVVSAVYT